MSLAWTNPTWNELRPRPLYLQIAHRLRAVAAALTAGERLPSETELAHELAVSRFTVARAIEELVRDGLVVRRQGAGTFVAPPALKRSAGAMQSFTRAVRAAGHDSASRLLAFGPVPWRHGLPFDRSEKLVAVQRLRLVDGAPGAWHGSTLTASVAAAIGLDDELAAAADLSLYERLEAAGLRVEHGLERVTARRATAAEARLLALDRDAVLAVVERVSRGADGQVLDFTEALYDARRFAYESRVVHHRAAKASPAGAQTGDPQHEDLRLEVLGPGARLGPWAGVRAGR